MKNTLNEIRSASNSARTVNSFDVSRLAALCAAVGLIVASAGFGAVYAWQSATTHGPVLGALAVLMAVSLEIIKPAAVVAALASFRSLALIRGVLLLALALAAVSYSLSAELSLFAKARSDSVAERVEHSARVTAAVAVRDRTQADLAALAKPARSSAEVRPYVNAARAGTKARVDLEAELARADAFEAARTRAESSQEVLAELGGTKIADPAASALVSYLTAIGFNIDPARLTDMLVLCGVLALEIGSALGMLVVAPMGRVPATSVGTGQVQAPATSTVATPSVGVTTGYAPNQAQVPVFPASSVGDHGVTAADQSTRAKLLAMVLASGGSIRTGQRELAAELGVSKTAVSSALRGLRDDGVLAARSSATGTTLTLASAGATIN